MYDILFDKDGKAVGVATTEQIDPKDFAERIGKPLSEVRTGKFVIRGDQLVASTRGKLYTYWSEVGKLDMVNVSLLSSVAEDEVYFFERDGEVRAFLSLDDASEEGFGIWDCRKRMALAAALLLCAMKETAEDPYIQALKGFLEPHI